MTSIVVTRSDGDDSGSNVSDGSVSVGGSLSRDSSRGQDGGGGELHCVKSECIKFVDTSTKKRKKKKM